MTRRARIVIGTLAPGDGSRFATGGAALAAPEVEAGGTRSIAPITDPFSTAERRPR